MIRTVVFTSLIPFALVGTVFGPLSSDIIHTTGMTFADIGGLISISQTGVFLAFLIQPALFKRFRAFTVLRFSLLLYTLGLVAVGLSRDRLLLTASYTYLSFASYLYSNSSFIALNETFPEKRSIYIPLTHLIYSVAAIGAGYTLIWFKGPRWYNAYLTAAVCFAIMFLLAFVKDTTALNQDAGPKSIRTPPPGSNRLLRRPEFITLCLFMMVYLASEGAAGTFAPMFVDITLQSDAATISAAVMLFWIGMTITRFLVVPVLKRRKSNPVLLLMWMLAVCLVATLVFATARTPRWGALLMLFLGFALGPMNPLLQVVIANWYADRLAFISNMNMMCSVVGRMLFPIAMTAVANQSSLRWSMLLMAGNLLLALLLLLGTLWLRKRLESHNK
ncbi:MAG: sugar MFS transporter [Sphaerochaetaceae bacterium]